MWVYTGIFLNTLRLETHCLWLTTTAGLALDLQGSETTATKLTTPYSFNSPRAIKAEVTHTLNSLGIVTTFIFQSSALYCHRRSDER
jgi:hypothetical protein